MKQLLTTVEAADYLTLSKGTLDRYRVTGEGPKFLRLGSAVRYRTADLDEWLDARLVSSTSQQVAA